MRSSALKLLKMLTYKSKKNLFDFYKNLNFNLNPNLFGFNGSCHLNGAGATYFVTKLMNFNDDGNSHIAFIGILGVIQDDAPNES